MTIVRCPDDLVIPHDPHDLMVVPQFLKLRHYQLDWIRTFSFVVAGAQQLWQNLCAMLRTFPEPSGRR